MKKKRCSIYKDLKLEYCSDITVVAYKKVTGPSVVALQYRCLKHKLKIKIPAWEEVKVSMFPFTSD